MPRTALFLFFLFAFPSGLQAGEEVKLTAAEILKLLEDRTALGRDRGKATRQYFDPSGWTEYQSEGGPPDRGRWRVDETQERYCSKWGAFGGWSCYDVLSDGERYYWAQGESYRSPFTLIEGYKMGF